MASFQVFAFALAFASACGSPPPPEEPKPPPPPPPVEAPKEEPRTMAVSTELGSIDEHDTVAAFRQLEMPFVDCHKRGLRRIRALGGDVQFFVRVGSEGVAKFAFVEKSSLGDRETEKCMLDHVLRASWPKPRGGDAEVRKKIELEAPSDTRKPVEWNSTKLDKALSKYGAPLRKCASGAGGSFAVTAYVVPKNARGKVLAVGVAAPNHDAEAKVECIVKEAKRLPVPSPGRGIAKVYFTL